MDTMEEKQPVELGRYGSAGLGLGLICTLVSIVLMFGTGSTAVGMQEGYIYGWSLLLMLTLGFFGLTLLHHTLRGKWGLPVMRIFEAGGSIYTIGLMAVLFLPILVQVWSGQTHLYPWTHPDFVRGDPALEFKTHYYLNATFFTVRFAIYFLSWLGLAAMMRRSSTRQDATGDIKEEQKRSTWGAIGLVWFFISATFAVTDWLMSLEPKWSSTMYGVWWAVQAGLAAISLTVILVAVNRNREPYKGLVTPNLTRDWGNLMLTLTMLWGYTSVSQYLIIWSGNLPEYTHYFVNRSHGGWNALGCALIFGQFFIPFFCLLTPRIKAVPMALARVAGWMLVMRIIEAFVLTTPAFADRPNPIPIWQDLLAVLGIGGLWLWAFSSVVRKSSLLPTYDVRLTEMEAHAH